MADYLTTDAELTSVANAIRTKGGTSASLVYPTGFVSAINAISGGTDVSDTTATAADVRTGKYFYTANGVKTQGTIQNQAAQIITPGTTDQTIASGKYLSGTQTIKGDANLIAGNIKQGVTIFGVQGTHSGGITPSGAISITQNGTYDVTSYASANVNVSGGGGITLKRIAGTGRNDVNVSGWGANDFATASALNENPPRVVFANVTYDGRIYTLSPQRGQEIGQYIYLAGAGKINYEYFAEFNTSGSYLNYKTIKLSSFYRGSTDVTSGVTGWEIYSNIPSVPQFTFDIEFEGAPIDTYSADEGMTWEAWLNSGYNTDQLYQMDGENVMYNDGSYQMYVCDSNLDPVTIDMEIIENETYQLVMM